MYRIVWITNTPTKAVKHHLGLPDFGSGTWLDNLLASLLKTKNFQFYIFSPYPVEDFSIVSSNVIYYSVQGSLSINDKTESEFLRKVAEQIKKISPDLVHVHGTEKISGLLGKYYGPFSFPVIVSLQGLTGPIFKVLRLNVFHTLNTILLSKAKFIVKLKWVYIYLNGLLSLYRSSVREKQVIAGNKYFFGRTDFDRSHIFTINPDADYFEEPRILRESFYNECWNYNDADKNSIILLNIRSSAKKAETALYAIATLLSKYPNIRIRIGGIDKSHYYGEYILKLASKMGIADRVELLGYLSETDTICWLKQSHVFCLTSLIENSPNTLAEAQILGMPCVAHDVGGVKSYVENNCSLTYSNNNFTQLAESIDRILADKDFAIALGENAYRIAQKRHNIGHAAEKIISVYKKLINQENESHLQ